MGIHKEHTHVGPFQAVTLANDVLRVVVVPELGGKIISLESRRSGREWLWRNPHLPLRKPPPDATDFGQFDGGGWDEIFPTVNPCRVPNSAWGSRTLTDHGELWNRPWQTPVAKFVPDETASLTLAVDDPTLPFRFERTLALSDGAGSLVASYELTNRSALALPYIWAAHPLVAIIPGDSIRLPAGTHMSSTGRVGLEFAAGATSFIWPTERLASGDVLDLSRVPERTAGFAVKLFAKNLSPGRIEIVDRSQSDFLRLSFAASELPHVGLWLNYGGWSGAGTEPYYNVGIEPTTSPHDDLSVVAHENTALQLPPGETRSWQLTVTLGEQLSRYQCA
jgi:galactose mutarotase-like enzyme